VAYAVSGRFFGGWVSSVLRCITRSKMSEVKGFREDPEVCVEEGTMGCR